MNYLPIRIRSEINVKCWDFRERYKSKYFFHIIRDDSKSNIFVNIRTTTRQIWGVLVNHENTNTHIEDKKNGI